MVIAMTMRPGVRYTGWRWKYVAHYIRARDKFNCRVCGNRGHIVHHKKWLKNGGSNMPGNLITVCERCHEKEHRWLKK